MPDAYAYLTWSVLLLACLAAGLWLCPRHRRPALIGGLYGAPYAVASLLFVPEYWRPVRLWDLAVGVEDLVFSFANGGLAWLVATSSARRPVSVDLVLRRSFGRYALCSTTGFLLALGVWLAGLGIMPSFYLSMVAMAGLLLLWRPSLWSIAVRGGVGFGLLYGVIALSVFALHPGLAQQFTSANLSGYTLLSMPVEELLWALGYGAVFPLILAYSFEASV